MKVVLRQLGWALEELGNPKASPSGAGSQTGGLDGLTRNGRTISGSAVLKGAGPLLTMKAG